eukprot:359433-Chlamydomonas_euryale.AAC.1
MPRAQPAGRTKRPRKGQGVWGRAAQGSCTLPRCTWCDTEDVQGIKTRGPTDTPKMDTNEPPAPLTPPSKKRGRQGPPSKKFRETARNNGLAKIRGTAGNIGATKILGDRAGEQKFRATAGTNISGFRREQTFRGTAGNNGDLKLRGTAGKENFGGALDLKLRGRNISGDRREQRGI